MTTKYTIEGMTCNGCRTRVENKLKELDTNASVDLETKQAVVSTEVKAEDVRLVVEELGYEVIS